MDWIERTLERISTNIANFCYKDQKPCLECIVQPSCDIYYCNCPPFNKYKKKVNDLDGIVESILEWFVIASFGTISIFLVVLIILGFKEFLKLV